MDYAHTEDALRGSSRAVRELSDKKIILVFGCGGDRDRGKRAPMGRIAGEMADIAIATSDNPRSESPAAILAEVEAGLVASGATKYLKIADRREAIRRAIELANPGTVVVIAGKGHETTQVIGDPGASVRRPRGGSRDDREGARRVIYRLLYPFAKDLGVLNVFRYITFRTAAAAVTALLLSLFLGPPMIRMLKRRLVGQAIREEGPKSHLSKAGTPTMGGLLILLAVFVATFLWMDLSNRFVWIALGILASLGLVGFADDYTKVSRKRSLGLTGRGKLVPQFLVAFAAAWAIQQWAGGGAISTVIAFPFLKKLVWNLGILYIPFVATVLVGSSNAVNLTDGLDGLAIGSVGIAAGTYAILTYVAGNAVAARYLQIPFVPQSGELAVFCGALAGASLGFLWFNCHPAEVFMGDVGSLPLGGAIAAVAVMTKQEVLLAIVGGLFVLEALSVIIQVVSFKTTGRRVFKMAPLHHHFELSGWAESRVIIRFWILAVLFSVLGLSTLKLR